MGSYNLGSAKINVLAIEDDEYASMFGSNYIITRVGGDYGYYFVSKGKMREEFKNVNSPFRTTVLPLSNDIHSPNQLFSFNSSNICGSKPWNTMNMKHLNYLDFFHPYLYDLESFCRLANADFRNSALDIINNIKKRRTTAPKRFMYSNDDTFYESQKTAEEYVCNPDYMILDYGKTFKDKNLVQCIDTLEDYIKLLEKNPGIEGDFKKQFDAWRALETWVNAQKPKQASEDPGVNYDTTKELYKALFDEEAFEIMQDTAARFYEQFYGEKGTELVNKYLDDLLNSKYPVMAYPLFPEPVYYYLKMFSDKFVLPCVNDLPDDSVAVFQSNSAFVEAYLCGMNTEMGRELLWREFPTDQRGSYFRKFWDSETAVKDILDDKYFDINSIHQWKGNLGENHDEAKEGLVLFTIKGKLMKQYPNTQVFLHRATQNRTIIDFDRGGNDEGRIKLPVIQAFLREDILMVGFKGEFLKLLGNPTGKDCGYILTFLQDVEDLNFEVNKEGTNGANAAEVANNLITKSTQFGKHLSLFI